MVLDTKAEASIVCIIKLDLEHLIPNGKGQGCQWDNSMSYQVVSYEPQ